MKKVLHVGSGRKRVVGKLLAFPAGEWEETRLDIAEAVQPDIVASMTDLSMIEDGSFDAIHSSHNLEHLFPHELEQALAEFLRVLKPGGFALIVVPDISAALKALAEGKADAELYPSPIGPITPIDIIYGHGDSIRDGAYYMTHRNGFVLESLEKSLKEAGFAAAEGFRGKFDLVAVAHKDFRPEGTFRLPYPEPHHGAAP